jgi:transcriptional regulatory protein LevR
MDLEERLNILVSGNVILDETKKSVLRVISRLKDQWQIELKDENGGRMVTHLAMALTRVKQNSEVNPLEQEQYEEFKSSDFFVRAVAITNDLCRWVPLDLPQAEREYLIVNICLILDNFDEG